jgi:hypothetical protein
MSFRGPTLKVFQCPRCSKRRMVRPEGHIVDSDEKEIKLSNGASIKHHVDVCDACQNAIVRTMYTPSKAELRKVIKAMHDSSVDLGDKSLEELL